MRVESPYDLSAVARLPGVVSFTSDELAAYRDHTVPDLIGPGVRLLFVGINPGLWTAAVQTHFAHPGNRFYPALLRASIITTPIDRKAGMSTTDRQAFMERGLGITNLVARATARAAELSTAELREGAARLEACVARHQPRVVALAGITAYRTAFKQRHATAGLQPEPLAGAQLWIVPNPSGLNAHETIETLAEKYAAAAQAAGVLS